MNYSKATAKLNTSSIFADSATLNVQDFEDAQENQDCEVALMSLSLDADDNLVVTYLDKFAHECVFVYKVGSEYYMITADEIEEDASRCPYDMYDVVAHMNSIGYKREVSSFDLSKLDNVIAKDLLV